MPEIALNPVESTLISAIGYDAETQILAVKFKSGGIYHYSKFSGEDWKAFQAAESVGRHFLQKIKGVFPYAKA